MELKEIYEALGLDVARKEWDLLSDSIGLMLSQLSIKQRGDWAAFNAAYQRGLGVDYDTWDQWKYEDLLVFEEWILKQLGQAST
jgi:hypothetical protein